MPNGQGIDGTVNDWTAASKLLRNGKIVEGKKGDKSQTCIVSAFVTADARDPKITALKFL
jgi:hypothetical protein